MLSALGASDVAAGEVKAGNTSAVSSSSDMTPSVKCSLRGGMRMLSSNPGIGRSSFNNKEEVKVETRVRRSGMCPFHCAP